LNFFIGLEEEPTSMAIEKIVVMGVSTKEKTGIGVDGVLILEFSILLLWFKRNPWFLFDK